MRGFVIFATLFVLTLFLAVEGPNAVLAGKKKTEAKGAAVNGLQLTLTADRSEITLKEGKVSVPVAFKLTFTNVNEKPIKFNAYDFSWSRIKGEVKAAPADAVMLRRIAADRKLASPATGDFFELKPGMSWSAVDRLMFPGSLPENIGGKSVYTVVKPGEFRVRFHYNSGKLDSPFADGIWTGELVSNEVVITAK